VYSVCVHVFAHPGTRILLLCVYSVCTCVAGCSLVYSVFVHISQGVVFVCVTCILCIYMCPLIRQPECCYCVYNVCVNVSHTLRRIRNSYTLRRIRKLPCSAGECRVSESPMYSRA